jgi:hypothetical protein
MVGVILQVLDGGAFAEESEVATPSIPQHDLISCGIFVII